MRQREFETTNIVFVGWSSEKVIMTFEKKKKRKEISFARHSQSDMHELRFCLTL
jgi:hypothetical protein